MWPGANEVVAGANEVVASENEVVARAHESAPAPSHWERWHGAYEDPSSPLSERLRLVQKLVRGRGASARFLLERDQRRPPLGDPGERIRIISLCAGQGRDVIDVLATHPRMGKVEALLVDLDPALVEFARRRAAEAGLAERVRGRGRRFGVPFLLVWFVPADVVLLCGIFGNVSRADIAATIRALPAFCRPGANVVWTRHRRPPDATPAVRAQFAAAGFTEIAFAAPDGFVLAAGRHRLDGDPGAFGPFDPDRRLFEFVGDGSAPA